MAQWLRDFTRGFRSGFAGGARGLRDLFLHPIQSIRSMANLRQLVSMAFSSFTTGPRIIWEMTRGRWYSAGRMYGQHIFSGAIMIITMGTGKFANKIRKYLTNNAIRRVGSYTVKTRHLPGHHQNFSKFNTSNQNTIRGWMRSALRNGRIRPNGTSTDSFLIVHNTGRVIGTRGERFIRVVFAADGKIITTHPQLTSSVR